MRPSSIRTSRTRLLSGGRVRVRWWRTAVVLVLTGAAACADGQRGDGSAPPTTIEVEIRGFEYRPAVIRVAPGDTIRWTNHDIVPHTVTSAEGSATGPDGATAPGDAAVPWDSGEITAGDSYTRVIAATEVGAYYCRYHPTMTATLERENPAGMER